MIHYINHEDAWKMIKEDDQRPYVLDVREVFEHEEVHIPSSHVIPLPSLAQDIETKKLDKDACIMIYCRTGRRSKEAAVILEQMGYTNLYEFGGIVDWPFFVETNKGSKK